MPPDASHAIVLQHVNGAWVQATPPPDRDLFDLAVAPTGELFAVSGPAVWRGVDGP